MVGFALHWERRQEVNLMEIAQRLERCHKLALGASTILDALRDELPPSRRMGPTTRTPACPPSSPDSPSTSAAASTPRADDGDGRPHGAARGRAPRAHRRTSAALQALPRRDRRERRQGRHRLVSVRPMRARYRARRSPGRNRGSVHPCVHRLPSGPQPPAPQRAHVRKRVPDPDLAHPETISIDVVALAGLIIRMTAHTEGRLDERGTAGAD